MIMKKNLFYAALAIVALASCTSDDFVGEINNPPDVPTDTQQITFGLGVNRTTRADIYGQAAAELLGNKFYVTGVKGDGTPANMNKVFQSYSVEWGSNTAGTTESNSSNWEYVGKTHDFTSTTSVSSQTIKYWDLSTAYYDFAAYSLGSGTSKATGTAIDYANATTTAYTLEGSRDQLAQCYISDMITVAKANYKNVVQLKFRSMGAKVRIAMYETIPGYSVKDVYFYTDDATAVSGSITNTAATLIGANAFDGGGKYTISFPTIGISKASDPDYNQAHVAITGTPTTTESTQAFGALNYEAAAEGQEDNTVKYMGRSSQSPSFAGTGTGYQTVLPKADGKVLELRVNYTLVSTDGSGETITVHGAKAFVPAAYTKWLPNFAYTYIFKLSDNSTGWTNPNDASDETLAGLFPITFDAVVLDSEETGKQTTITTVALPSITTYMKGHDYSAKNSYPAGDIYLQVMNGGTLVNDLNATGKSFLYTLSADKTEVEVMDALNIVASETSGTITGRNGLVLTPASFDATVTAIPGEDGNDIKVTAGQAVKFTGATGTYAYVYQVSDGDDTNVLLAETLTAAPTDWATTGVWYTDAAGTTAAPATFAAGTYYKKMYTNLNKVFAVKVIKVE